MTKMNVLKMNAMMWLDVETINCNDNNVCTLDSCDPQSGCSNSPISCDDGNVCTIDSCDAKNRV
jgi:hypothetical protein